MVSIASASLPVEIIGPDDSLSHTSRGSILIAQEMRAAYVLCFGNLDRGHGLLEEGTDLYRILTSQNSSHIEPSVCQ